MKHIFSKLTVALITAGAISASYGASGMPDAPMPVAQPSFSHWLFRLRAIDVIPDESSNHISHIGGKVTDISSQVVPEIDVNYFFTQHISAELIAATSKHSVTATKTALGKVDLGSTRILPPTLTLLYHAMPTKVFSPYVGAGINYTYFYDESHGPVASKIDYGNSFGPAVQAGFDVNLNQHWSLNADVKKVWVESDVKATALGLPLKTDVKINPWVVGIGIGYRI